MVASPQNKPAVFQIRCGYKNCSQVSDPQPTEEAMRKWLKANSWKHAEGQMRCWLCALALRPNQGRWGSD